MAVTTASSFAGTTIRCSSCNAEIDFTQAGEHNCRNTANAQNPGISVFDRLSPPASSMSSHRNAPLSGKLPKFAPSRIDPFAANESFLTPQSGAGFHSDLAMNNPIRTGSPASARFRMPPRSATTPHFRERSRSPDMLMSQDSAFPLFPTRKVREKEAKKDRQRSKSMSRSQSRDRSAWQSSVTNGTTVPRPESPASSQFTPRPSTAGTASRKNSISSLRSRSEQVTPSNFAEPVPPLPVQHDANGRPPLRSDANSGGFHDSVSQASSPLAAPPIGFETDWEKDNYQGIPSQHSEGNRQYSPLAIDKPLDAIESVARPSYEHTSVVQRSQSASGHRNASGIEMAPSTREPMSAVVEKSSHDWPGNPTVPDSLVIRRPPPVAEMPRTEVASQDGLHNLPTFKSSGHNTTAFSAKQRTSASSDGSSYSRSHSISSQSSPPTSASSFMLHDNTTKEDVPEIASGEKSRRAPLQDSAAPSVSPIVPPPLVTSQRQRGPAKSFSRPNYARPQLDSPDSVSAVPAQPSPRAGPATHNLSNYQSRENQSFSNAELRQASSEVRSPVSDLRTSPSFAASGLPDRPFSPMSPRTPQMLTAPKVGESSVNPPRRPNTPGVKGNCRGCGEIIVGKSVSSADGRLQGRYHKKCFVCQTCKEPFQTVDFYVINNQPYCQRHYHTLNGSMCGNCDRGIEGPYMETDAKRKFHPHCFTCKECHLILRSDYFEVNGIIYCEKHSRKPDLLGPGRRYPERRTTRLMMM